MPPKMIFHFALLVCLAAPLHAQDMPGMPAHHHHDDAPASLEKLGNVYFAVSCAASQRAPFERGVALLHSFGYVEAEAQFRKIAADDPTCAMAHWGIAMTQYQELWGRPSPEMVKAGAEETGKAKLTVALPTHITEREMMYITALEAFFQLASQDFLKAADAYAVGMRALHEKYPDDIEGAAFYALAEIASVAPDDSSLTKETRALNVLVPLFEKNPDHPGLAHYIIHTCDTPRLAPRGLEAAKVYAGIAPSSAHALHMPGHIFARLGMWQQDIASNEASVKASEKAAAEHMPGAAHQMHADEFLIYAYLQVGEDEKARVLTEDMHKVSADMLAMPGMDDMKDAGHFFENELNTIYPLEMHDWKRLATLKPAPDSKHSEAFTVYWGQGVAAGHLHNVKAVEAALKAYLAEEEALKLTPYSFLLNGAEVKRMEIEGWHEFTLGHADAAVKSMRQAADQQDKMGQDEVDIPAREMLGDLLMELHRPQEALAEYKVALKHSPNRLNGLLSAGAAEEAIGNKSGAANYYTQAASNTNNAAASKRPELLHAVSIAKQNPKMASME